MSEPKEYRLPKMGVSQKGRVVLRKMRSENNVRKAYRKYNSYDESKWEKTAFYPDTGGYLVTDRKRIAQMGQDTDKDRKEIRTANFFASKGFQIEYLEDMPGTYDVNVVGKARFIVNGKRADMKSSVSGNNIVHYAKHAVKDQGAEFVLIEFQQHHKKISEAINEMRRNHIKGYYYFMGEDKYYAI